MIEDGVQARLRRLPSVDKMLQMPETAELSRRYGHELIVEAIRQSLAAQRATIFSGGNETAGIRELLLAAEQWLEVLLAPTLQPVINATGIILHTNLGRAPLSDSAIAAVQAAASSYSTLEYDVREGKRGSRTVHAEHLLTHLTGAESALVVNNNAAAVLLMLTALCQDKEVIISRSQMVEIGGGFRVPDVMAQSGARLVEVGTTNRTHLRDYEAAISEDTAAILIAHHSNFKIIGFTAEPTLAELADLAHKYHIPLLYDQGSGALLDTNPFGLEPEPMVPEAVVAGCDIVTFSGDKLLGGPQAGILCGRDELISQLKIHPLARAVRADKMCLAGLGATLQSYMVDRAEAEIPVWHMISRSIGDLDAEASSWASALQAHGIDAEVVDSQSAAGGGSLPGTSLDTRAVAIRSSSVDQLAYSLRNYSPPIVGRIQEDAFLVDPRTVLVGQGDVLVQALISCSRALQAAPIDEDGRQV